MLAEYDANRDPVKTMDVLKALRWGVRAWDFDMTSETIRKCFRKALVDRKEVIGQSDAAAAADISSSLARLNTQGLVSEPVDINDFLYPEDTSFPGRFHDFRLGPNGQSDRPTVDPPSETPPPQFPPVTTPPDLQARLSNLEPQRPHLHSYIR